MRLISLISKAALALVFSTAILAVPLDSNQRVAISSRDTLGPSTAKNLVDTLPKIAGSTTIGDLLGSEADPFLADISIDQFASELIGGFITLSPVVIKTLLALGIHVLNTIFGTQAQGIVDALNQLLEIIALNKPDMYADLTPMVKSVEKAMARRADLMRRDAIPSDEELEKLIVSLAAPLEQLVPSSK